MVIPYRPTVSSIVAKRPGLTGTVPEFGPLSRLCPGQHLCPGILKIFTYLELRVAKNHSSLKEGSESLPEVAFFKNID